MSRPYYCTPLEREGIHLEPGPATIRLAHTTRKRDGDSYRDLDQHNGKQFTLLPFHIFEHLPLAYERWERLCFQFVSQSTGEGTQGFGPMSFPGGVPQSGPMYLPGDTPVSGLMSLSEAYRLTGLGYLPLP